MFLKITHVNYNPLTLPLTEDFMTVSMQKMNYINNLKCLKMLSADLKEVVVFANVNGEGGEFFSLRPFFRIF